MEKVIMCFPGQGSQKPKMAIDLYNYSATVKKLFEEASDISHLNLYKILAEGDAEELKQTEIAQNAIILASLSAYSLLLEKGIEPLACAGFSLGELMALRASEIIDNEKLFNLVQKRSLLMAQASAEATKQYGEMGMAAVLNLNKAGIEEVINNTNYKNVFVANNNTESQVVISGVKEEIDSIAPLLKEKGARRIIMLKVSGPFHTPLLKSAEIEFDKYLNKVVLNSPKVDVYSNVTGKIEKDMKPFIPKQITNKVQWIEIMKDMKERFPNQGILEVGVSNTLTNFFKSEDMVCNPCGTVEQIEGI
jgi:[acyl-carrier-protein] S-malonyltransferase